TSSCSSASRSINSSSAAPMPGAGYASLVALAALTASRDSAEEDSSGIEEALIDGLQLGDAVGEGDAHDIGAAQRDHHAEVALVRGVDRLNAEADRKSTRLNSSHVAISYAVFCLKKKTSE